MTMFSIPLHAAASSPGPLFKSSWVQNFLPTHLWSSPADPGVDYGPVPQWSYLLVAAPQTAPRLLVYVPWTKNYAFVDARSVGPSGPPTKDWLDAIAAVPDQAAQDRVNWIGRAADGFAERASPSAQAAISKTVPVGTVVGVIAWVMGDELAPGDWTWAKLADGGYAYGETLQIVPPTSPRPIPSDHPSGQWIDVNLLQQTAVAYQDATPVYMAIVSTGSPGWETPVGLHAIGRRVADETMAGTTLSHLVLDAWQAAHLSYNLSHVLDTQYFDDLGDALHENYWLSTTRFGVPHSHGCVGMQPRDAEWFWNWASEGTSILIRPN